MTPKRPTATNVEVDLFVLRYYFASNLGKNVESCGTYVIIANKINKAINIGTKYLNVDSNLTLATLAPINKFSPKGGVNKPIVKLKHTTIPKCNGSIPKGNTIGNKIGTKIKIAATVSINIPTTNKNILISNSTKNGLVVNSAIEFAINCGICSKVKILPKNVAVPTKIITVPDVIEALEKTSIKSLNDTPYTQIS